MNKGFERRLKKLEDQYAARLGSRRVIGIKFLTAEDLSRGLGPGLHDEDLSGSSDAIDGSAEGADLRSSPPGIDGSEVPPL
jgi:hypothetical protein